MSLGFENAGFQINAAFDHWGPALSVYRKNFGHDAYEVDLGSEEAIEEISRLQPDLIIGGPPCQDFSSAGPNNFNPARATLIGAFVGMITSSSPRYFVMENVPRARISGIYKSAISELRKHGYGLTESILNASYFGVPQARKRLFLVGRLNGIDNELASFLCPPVNAQPLSMREYFGDSLDIDYYFRIPTTYKRKAVFSVDEPCVTIRGVERPIPSNYKKHPDDPVSISEGVRALTIEERALIQTFPESFKFSGTKTNLNQMIGNAVPIKLAEHVARSILSFEAQCLRTELIREAQQ